MRKSAEEQLQMGFNYLNGLNGYSEDNSKALACFKEAAADNNALGICMVGEMHQYGFGTKKDYDAAFAWYKRSADMGCGRAEFRLGWLYGNASMLPAAIEYNEAYAAQYYRRAWEHGYRDNGGILEKFIGTGTLGNCVQTGGKSNPTLSLSLFKQAVEKKREGNFAEAIHLQKQSIAAYPDDPDIMQNYYALGKTFYLAKNYGASVECYKVYNGMCVLKNNQILRDYQLMRLGDERAKLNLILSFRNLAHNVGQVYRVSMAPRNMVEWYRCELMGKDPEAVPSLAGRSVDYEAFDAECINAGFDVIFSWFHDFLDDYESANREILKLSESVLHASCPPERNWDSLVNNSNTENERSVTPTEVDYMNFSEQCFEADTQEDDERQATPARKISEPPASVPASTIPNSSPTTPSKEEEGGGGGILKYLALGAGGAMLGGPIGCGIGLWLAHKLGDNNDNDQKEATTTIDEKNGETPPALGSECVGEEKNNGTCASDITVHSEERGREELLRGETFFDIKNYSEAMKYYRKAAEEGNADAMYKIGDMYRFGHGMERNKAESEKWYQSALNCYCKETETGNADAMYKIGEMYRLGRGVKGKTQSEEWYRRAFNAYNKDAENGNPGAMYQISKMYYYGYGVEKNDEEALRWEQKAKAFSVGHELKKQNKPNAINTGSTSSAPRKKTYSVPVARKKEEGKRNTIPAMPSVPKSD